MKLKEFLEKYCAPQIAICVTDSWALGEGTFDYRGYVENVLEKGEIRSLYGDKIVKSIDVYHEMLFILVEP